MSRLSRFHARSQALDTERSKPPLISAITDTQRISVLLRVLPNGSWKNASTPGAQTTQAQPMHHGPDIHDCMNVSDKPKTRFDLIPFAAIGEIADVLAFGAGKYGTNNWCAGAGWGRYFSALCRHIFAWWGGEDKDPETGCSHLAHAGCCLIFLMEYQRNGWGTDDRFTGPDGEQFTKDDGN